MSTCGTPQGRSAHRRLGEPMCDPCRLAWNDYMRGRQAAARRRGWVRPDREPPKLPMFAGGTCSKCGTALRRSGLADPLCAPCRGNISGYTIPITREARLAIYERDSWICQLCNKHVDPATPPNARWGATLDHIVPRTKGGAHAASNLRLAHRRCNAVRGNREEVAA